MLKEDYDFTCQHIELHGAAVRLNRLFVKALHRVNPGGAVADRSSSKVGWVDGCAKATLKKYPVRPLFASLYTWRALWLLPAPVGSIPFLAMRLVGVPPLRSDVVAHERLCSRAPVTPWARLLGAK